MAGPLVLPSSRSSIGSLVPFVRAQTPAKTAETCAQRVRKAGNIQQPLQYSHVDDTGTSMASPNSSQDEEFAVQELLEHSFSSPKTPITRTVAIIKNHALEHRFDIERRIQEASFEIVKERQMEFDTETDPETLEELFGEDTYSLAEGPVWVYVLERRRAVEVWHTLMGARDPEVARDEAPNSLRALYGKSAAHNGLMGSQDNDTAEIQIAALFASSPPFPTSELPLDDDKYDSLRSIASSVLDSLAQTNFDDGYAPSSVTNPSTVNGSSTKLNSNGKPLFRARPVPASAVKPDIVPRMTKSAALRTGQPIELSASSPRKPVTKERLAQTFANVPGHKRAGTISVASTAAPVIAPRMTRAASLRLGQTPAPPPIRKRSLTNEDVAKKNTFEGIPGHKRRESIPVASSKAPTVAPRLNKSAALRVQREQAPPTSFMFRDSTAPKTPGSVSRMNSTENLKPSVSHTRATSASAPPRRLAPRPSSVVAVRPPPRRSSIAPAPSAEENSPGDPEPASKLRPRPSSVCAVPSIPPRTNRSAALRAAKKEAEANAVLVKKAASKRAAPSSFKTVAT